MIEIIPNPVPFGSRSRATWHRSPAKRAGYLRRGTHDVVEVDNCMVLTPELETVRRDLSILETVRALSNGVDVSVIGSGNVPDTIDFTVAGENIHASANVFFQASVSLLNQFVNYVIEVSEATPEDDVVDLYSGIGLFALPLARRSARVDAVESDRQAIEFAAASAREAGLENAHFRNTTVEKWIRSNQKRHPNVIVVDPPRIGLSAMAMDGLMTMVEDRLIYVSCDPATFARDARILVDAGMRFSSLRAFDMFPQTHHVELVARFDFGAH